MKEFGRARYGKIKQSEEENKQKLEDAGLIPEKPLKFETVPNQRWPLPKKKREIKKFDDTIEPNVIKLRKHKLEKGFSSQDSKLSYIVNNINGYFLETVLCILLRERKFTREQVAELFDITLHEATNMLKGKHKGYYFFFTRDGIIERLEKLGYTVAQELD